MTVSGKTTLLAEIEKVGFLLPMAGAYPGFDEGGCSCACANYRWVWLIVCTRTRSETLQILQQDIQLDYKLLWAGQWL